MHVRGVVEHLIAEGGGTDVVVLAHSYGGTVATEALEGLGIKEGKGGVKRLVFLSAVAPRVGENQVSAMKLEEGFLPEATVSRVSFLVVFQDVCGCGGGVRGGSRAARVFTVLQREQRLTIQDGYMHMDPVVMAPFVANDLPYAEAYENALQLPHHSAVSFQGEVTKCSYKDIPLSYIFCERDMVISPAIQQRFIETIEEVSGSKVDVKNIDAGHVPMWSKMDETVRLLIEAALQ